MSARFFKHTASVLLSGAAIALLAGCETTGDPMEGGLFRWSEAKAQERITVKEGQLTTGRRQRAREAQTSLALRDRSGRNRRAIGAQIEAREAQRDADRATALAAQRAEANREHQALRGILEKAEALERDSPSPAIASRARRLRAQIERTARAPELTRSQKEERIGVMNSELDRSRAEAGLQP